MDRPSTTEVAELPQGRRGCPALPATAVTQSNRLARATRSHRLAQCLHQPVRPGEHRDRMGEIENLEIGQALRAQRRRIGRADRRGIARQLGGIIEDRLAARIERGLDFVGLDSSITSGALVSSVKRLACTEAQ